MSEITDKQIEYIRNNYNGKNEIDLSKRLNINVNDVKRIIDSINSKNNKNKSVPHIFPLEIDHIYRFTITDYIIFFILLVLSWFVYAYTMTPGIAAGDAGELTCAVYFLGGAHSPGYPLYCIVGKFFMGLFFFAGRIVYRLTFFVALGGAFTAACSYLFFLKFMGRYHNSDKWDNIFLAKVPAIAAALIFLFSDELWAQSVIAEVYTLNSLFLPLMFLLALIYEERYTQNMNLLSLNKTNELQYIWNRPIKIMYLFYFLFGVCAGDHHVIFGYFVPFTFFFLYNHLKDKAYFTLLIAITLAYSLALIKAVYFQMAFPFHYFAYMIIAFTIVYIYLEHPKLIKIAIIAGGFLALGLFVYAYMPIRSLANAPLDWGDPEHWENLVNVVTRKQYRGFSQNIRTLGTFIEQSKVLIEWHIDQFTPYLAGFALLGLYRLYKISRKWFFFTLSFLLYFDVAFMQFNNFKFTARDLYFAKVFFIPSYMVAAFWVFIGLEYIMSLINKYILNNTLLQNKKMGITVSACIISLSLIPLSAHFHNNNVRHAWANDTYGKNLLNTLEYNSVLFTEGGDNQVFTLLYHTYVEHLRPDVNIYDQKGNVFLLYGDMMRMTPQQLRESQIVNDYKQIATGRPIYYTWKDFNRQKAINERYGENLEYRQTGILYRVCTVGEPFEPAIDYWPYYHFEWKQYPKEALYWDYLSREIIANYNFQFADFHMEKAQISYYMYKQYQNINPQKAQEYFKNFKTNDQIAYDNYRKAQVYGFDMTAIHFNLGLLLEQKIRILRQEGGSKEEINKLWDEVIHDYLWAAEIENGFDNAPRAYFTAARAYEQKAYYDPDHEKENIEQALINYKKALEVSPGYRDAQISIRRTEAMLKYPNAVLKDLEAKLIQKPKAEQLYFDLARAYADRGDINNSIRVLKQGKIYLPGNVNLIFNLAILYFQLQQFQESYSTFEELRRLNPQEPTVYFYLAENLFSLKKYKEAYNYYKTFSKIGRSIQNPNGQIQQMVGKSEQRVRDLAPYYEN